MKVIDYLNYLRAQKFSTAGNARLHKSREDLISYVNEGVRQAAQILIQAKDPWMLTEWEDALVADQQTYSLTTIAGNQGTVTLDAVANFAKLHSVHVRSQDNKSWQLVKMVDRFEGLMFQSDTSGRAFEPMARFRMAAVSGASPATEHDYEVIFVVPPNYGHDPGLKIGFYAMPAELAANADDDFEPALPSVATRFVKLASLMEALMSEGNVDGMNAVTPLLAKEARILAENTHGGISEEPQYVMDNDMVETELGTYLPG